MTDANEIVEDDLHLAKDDMNDLADLWQVPSALALLYVDANQNSFWLFSTATGEHFLCIPMSATYLRLGTNLVEAADKATVHFDEIAKHQKRTMDKLFHSDVI